MHNKKPHIYHHRTGTHICPPEKQGQGSDDGYGGKYDQGHQKMFPNAQRVIDRFHVQKLAYGAVQDARIKYRWETLDEENRLIEEARKNKQTYLPEVFSNGVL